MGAEEAGRREPATTTPSAKAPADPAPYDLIVLASPVYAGAAAKPLTRYAARVIRRR